MKVPGRSVYEYDLVTRKIVSARIYATGINGGLTVLTNRNNPTMLVYTVVGSLILYILPVWIIKTIVQKMRRK